LRLTKVRCKINIIFSFYQKIYKLFHFKLEHWTNCLKKFRIVCK
jgi:hypothetical protein